MSLRRVEPLPLRLAEAFGLLNVDHLKPLVELLSGETPKRKAELIAVLHKHLSDPAEVRALYAQLEPLEQLAVREAAHQQQGLLQRARFVARHGRMPEFTKPPTEAKRYSYSYDHYKWPTLLSLFFPTGGWLPTDLRQLLLTFVPPPEPFKLPTLDCLPETVELTWKEWEHHRSVTRSEEVPLRVRETAREAEQDVRAVLRLIEAGRVRVSDKKRQPTAASRQAMAPVLHNGDFFTPEDQDQYTEEGASDLGIKTFAWPMLVQAAGLAEKSGDALSLSPAGRKALTRASADVLRAAFRKWRTSTILDEFNRVEVIKGQSKGGLSALGTRRRAVLDGLAACPPGSWFHIDDFFRFLRATERDFTLTHRPWDLYIGHQEYGHYGYSNTTWEELQGRYVLALFFEYLATLGLLDVGYIPPQDARDDFRGHWGVDDLSCLSRYDGLLYVRINPLGAWCLELAEDYETPPAPVLDVLRVLPNLDIVVTKPPLPAADRLVLDRYAEPVSDNTWKLTPTKFATVLEEGGTLTALEELLKTRSVAELPHTVEVFLKDQRERAGRLRDLGTARLIECADATLAQMLAHDPQLRGKCHLAGERWLVFQAQDETAVRKSLRRLGHVLPAPGG